MTPHTTTADRIAQLGASAGEKLWLAIEDAYEAGMSGMANAFERALEQITEEIDCEFKAKLFSAAAMQAIPIVLLSTAQRKRIAGDFENNYTEAVNELHADEDAAAADWAYDCARDAKLLGDAA